MQLLSNAWWPAEHCVRDYGGVWSITTLTLAIDGHASGRAFLKPPRGLEDAFWFDQEGCGVSITIVLSRQLP